MPDFIEKEIMQEEHCEDYGVRSESSLMYPSCDTDLQALERSPDLPMQGTSTNLELLLQQRCRGFVFSPETDR